MSHRFLSSFSLVQFDIVFVSIVNFESLGNMKRTLSL